MLKRPLIIAVIIFSFGLGYVAGVASTPSGTAIGSEAEASAPKVQVTATGRRCHVNSESYAKLRMGMSLKQVEGIINCPGEAVSENRIGRVTTEAYIWRAGYGAGIEAVFQRQTISGSSRLMSLAQHGL